MTQYLQRIENRMAVSAAQVPLKIRLTRSPEHYVATSANGEQYLSAGLVNFMENEMELAGLLAHQLAHRQVEAATTAHSANTSLYVPPCVLSPFGVPGGSGPKPNLEMRANAQALSYLKAAGYDPEGLLSLFSKLAYEHPTLAQAIVPEDLLSLRSTVEDEGPPSGGYRVNTSEFSEQHHNLLVLLDQPIRNSARPTLTRR